MYQLKKIQEDSTSRRRLPAVGCRSHPTDQCTSSIVAGRRRAPPQPPRPSTASNPCCRTGVSEGTRREQTPEHPTGPDEPHAPFSCSERAWACWMTRDRPVVPRSGRRGRRFKSCHPDSRVRRSQALPRASPDPADRRPALAKRAGCWPVPDDGPASRHWHHFGGFPFTGSSAPSGQGGTERVRAGPPRKGLSRTARCSLSRSRGS